MTKSIMNLCPHGRRKASCRECGGSSTCEHGKKRRMCLPCGGSGVCVHGRQKSDCKDCGTGLCIHGIKKSSCRECSPLNFCVHGKRRTKCTEGCGGGSMCEHEREKAQCRYCKGKSMCIHERKKRNCKKVVPNNTGIPCGGENICSHNKLKWSCKAEACVEKFLCKHGGKKKSCIMCKETLIIQPVVRTIQPVISKKMEPAIENCVHDRLKNQCMELWPVNENRQGMWRKRFLYCS
jgi:hypothetical protein